MRRTIALTAWGVIASLAVAPLVGARAEVGPDIPNAKQVGKRYLKIVCPANIAETTANDAFHRAFGGKVQLGTPVPSDLRQKYVRAAKATSRAAVKMNRAHWPDEIQYDINRITRYYYTAPAAYRARNTPTVTRGWNKKATSSGRAGTHIRIALGLPPAGEGCGKIR